ncbi:hypothetical protein ACSMXN_11130 [Jatrophihabitans sp. DSM 45814]
MTEPERRSSQRLTPAARLAAGVMLAVIAALSLGGARLVSGSQRHAYDRGAVPAPTYHITAGRTYQLSSADGVAKLTKAGVLGSDITPVCMASAPDGATRPITISGTRDDPRDLHVFATFTADQTGSFHFACNGVSKVFVDDADDSPADLSAVLVVLASVFGVCGVALAMSGGYGLRRSEVAGDPRRNDALGHQGVS